MRRYYSIPELAGEDTPLLCQQRGVLQIAQFTPADNLIPTPSFEFPSILPVRETRTVESGDTFTVGATESAVLYGALEVEDGGTVEVDDTGSLEVAPDSEQTTPTWSGAFSVAMLRRVRSAAILIRIQDGYTGVADEPRNGVYVEIEDLEVFTDYFFSVYLRGGSGTHRITVRGNTNFIVESQSIAASTDWQRVTLSFNARTTDPYRLYVEADDASTSDVITDAWMLSTINTEYGDGSFPGWIWNGTPDNSTSTRKTGLSGTLMDVGKQGLIVTGLVSHLVPVIEPIRHEYGGLPGAYYARERVASRTLTLTGRLQGETWLHLQMLRADLWALLNPSTRPLPSATTLRYQPNADVAQAVEIDVIYQGGMQGDSDNDYGEDIELELLALAPYWRGVEQQSQAITSGANTVAYQGTAPAPVVIAFTGAGSITSIVIGSAAITITQTLTSGDYYIIDTEALTVELNGLDARDTITVSSDLIGAELEPGDNTVTLTAAAGVTCAISWYERYLTATGRSD
jgi:phage-related protein